MRARFKPTTYKNASNETFTYAANPTTIFWLGKQQASTKTMSRLVIAEGGSVLKLGYAIHRPLLFNTPIIATPETIKRAFNPATAAIEHMGINHSCRHIGMTQQFLHRANVVAAL